MSALVRTAIGPFTLERRVEAAKLSAQTIQAALQDPILAVAHLPQLGLSQVEQTEVLHGRTIADPFAGQHSEVAAVDATGQLVALVAPQPGGILRPTHCFVQTQ